MQGEITQGDDATKHAIKHAKLFAAKSAGPGPLTVKDCLVNIRKHSWSPERNPASNASSFTLWNRDLDANSVRALQKGD